MITRKIFDEAPVDYKGSFTQKWYDLLDKYESDLEKKNEGIPDENDKRKIMHISLDRRSVDEYVKRLNYMPSDLRQVLFVGAPIYKQPNFVVLIGPISSYEYDFYMGVEL